jgi:hypothetical protein
MSDKLLRKMLNERDDVINDIVLEYDMAIAHIEEFSRHDLKLYKKNAYLNPLLNPAIQFTENWRSDVRWKGDYAQEAKEIIKYVEDYALDKAEQVETTYNDKLKKRQAA